MSKYDNDYLVTVLIITYNHAKHIKKAIESVLEQETDFDFRLYIYDDASTDGTSDIVKQYAARYPNKVSAVIQEENKGAVDNTYQALCSIKTEFFIEFEGDDYWCDKSKLQSQVEALRNNPDSVCCVHKTILYNAKTKESNVSPKCKEQFIVLENAPYLHTSSRLYRNIVDFTKEDKTFISTDLFIFYKFLSLGKFVFIDKAMTVYNQTGEGSWSNISLGNQKKNNRLAFFKLDQYFDYKYTNVFRPMYLNSFENEKTIFMIKVPFTKRAIKISKVKL